MSIYISAMILAVGFACMWEIYLFRKVSVADGFQIGNRRLSFNMPRIFMALSLICMWLVPSLIVGTGGDYWNYVQMFYQVADGIAPENVEYGFYIVCKAIQLFTDNPQFLFVVMNLLSYLLFFKCVKDYSVCYPLSVLCFYMLGMYFIGLPQMRQLLSIMLLFFSYRYIMRGQFLRFLFVVLLAAMFHISSFLAIPFYFLLRLRFKWSYFVIFGIIFLAIGTVAEPLIQWLVLTFYPQYTEVNGGYYLQVQGFNYYNFLFSMPILIWLAFYYRRLDMSDAKNLVPVNASIWYLLLNGTCYWMPTLYRLIAFLNIMNVITIPLLLKQEPDKRVRFLFVGLTMIYFGIFLYRKFVVNESNFLLPYIHIFNWK